MDYGKLIGTGLTAKVYEWKDNKVLKLFHKGYPREAIEKELYNARAIAGLDFAKPGVYRLYTFGKQYGIIYERVKGQSLLEWVIKTGDLKKCAEYMATLHKQILRNKGNKLPDYKDFLRNNLLNIPAKQVNNRKEILELLEKLQNGNILCHGDFHPGNIFISEGVPIVIDFMNICQGPFLYDVARTVFLLEEAPIPAGAENKDLLLQFRRALTDLYLKEMEVNREQLEDYLRVIKVARLAECPG